MICPYYMFIRLPGSRLGLYVTLSSSLTLHVVDYVAT